jgi:adenine-specific DNA-methyltransferase
MQLGLFSQYPRYETIDSVTNALKLITESASQAIPSAKKAEFSQFFTPITIAKQMAAMVNREDLSDIGDHGAGTGILSATLIAMKHNHEGKAHKVSAYEIDSSLHTSIRDNLGLVHDFISKNAAGGVTETINQDFMSIAQDVLAGGKNETLDAIVLNPPYQKLNQQTELALLFRKHGVPVPNLYAAFMVLSVLMLRSGGEMVAIIPRSFCNGDYYKPFRKWLLAQGSLDWFVRYKRRSNCFKGDNILQENLIVRFTKAVPQASTIRVSLCDNPEKEPTFNGLLPHTDILDPNSGAIHIPANNDELTALHEMAHREFSFSDLELTVGTGKLEDNRMANHMTEVRENHNQVPVIYSQHWNNTDLKMNWHHQIGKKCYLNLNELTKKKCIPAGRYILIKRISANDDRAGRCHPCLVSPIDVAGDFWGIDNHIQVVSIPDSMSDDYAQCVIRQMSSKTANDFFRIISGTTQLNCNDIRKLRFY